MVLLCFLPCNISRPLLTIGPVKCLIKSFSVRKFSGSIEAPTVTKSYDSHAKSEMALWPYTISLIAVTLALYNKLNISFSYFDIEIYHLISEIDFLLDMESIHARKNSAS